MKPKKPKGMNYAQVLQIQREAQAAQKLKQQTDRIIWLMICSMADAYDIGPKRAEKFFSALRENAEELQKMRDEVDDDYAYGKLRARAEQITGVDLGEMIY